MKRALARAVVVVALCAAVAADPIGPNSELGTYTNFVNLLDWCALAVPGRPRADGFPAGVTLLAPRGSDGLLAALGARLHALAAARIGAGTTPVPAAEPGPARALPGAPLVRLGGKVARLGPTGAR